AVAEVESEVRRFADERVQKWVLREALIVGIINCGLGTAIWIALAAMMGRPTRILLYLVAVVCILVTSFVYRFLPAARLMAARRRRISTELGVNVQLPGRNPDGYFSDARPAAVEVPDDAMRPSTRKDPQLLSGAQLLEWLGMKKVS